ncbi:MAG: glycosyltransferase family 4 protein, partial [Rhodocyclaceae bacterium]|nr:glycosyltransferase family 4 protein [Rhodocyclaceae bacterium]
MKRRLLFVVNVDWYFLSHRLPIALAARQHGYEVHVATGLTAPASAIADHGFVVHPLQLERGSSDPFEAVRLLRELHRLFRALQPDLVHLVTIKPVLLGGIAARLARVPAVVAAVPGLGYVFSARGVVARARRMIVSQLYRRVFGHPNLRVIVQNRDDLELLRQNAGLDPERASLIRGSGVDLSVFVPVAQAPGAPLVLLAARLLADKGVREFAVAARRLRAYRGARFVLAGDPDIANPASIPQAELQAWLAEGFLEWWGYRADMPAVLAAASIVVLPSYREGLPKLLAEAAACGRAVITTDVPGCRDAVVAGQTALLVPPRDADALA